MMPSVSRTLIGTLEGCGIFALTKYEVLRVEWLAKLAVCNDGSGGNPDNDPCHQAQTAYWNNGNFLNPYEVPYIVVPPLIIESVEPVVLGCQGLLINVKNGLSTPAICGEVGPDEKIGEASVEACRRIGLNPSPNSGGTDLHEIAYAIWPGIPAIVDGITYKLQASA
jgi:hypothetical protein